MFIPSHKPLCWESGRWCVTFLYVLTVWSTTLNVVAQENLMKARDERVALMNEVREFANLPQNSERMYRLAS